MIYKQFETGRLRLVPTSTADSKLIFQLMNTPKFIEYVGDRSLHSEQDAEKYIASKMVPQLEKLGYSSYTLIRLADGMKMGTCGLYDRPGVEGIDLGFGLLPEFEGKGYAYEAAKRLVEASFTDFKLKELKAITSKENTASQQLLKKLHFTPKGTLNLSDEEELLLFTLSAS